MELLKENVNTTEAAVDRAKAEVDEKEDNEANAKTTLTDETTKEVGTKQEASAKSILRKTTTESEETGSEVEKDGKTAEVKKEEQDADIEIAPRNTTKLKEADEKLLADTIKTKAAAKEMGIKAGTWKMTADEAEEEVRENDSEKAEVNSAHVRPWVSAHCTQAYMFPLICTTWPSLHQHAIN